MLEHMLYFADFLELTVASQVKDVTIGNKDA
jgi:hypothetical protein